MHLGTLAITIPNEEPLVYTYMEHPGSVFVVPITPSGEIILLHTYRYPVDDWCWEVPAGGLGDTTESPEQAALTELEEEIGGQAGRIEKIGEFYSQNGVASNRVHYFAAYDVELKTAQKLEITEVIDRVESFSADEVLQMIADGNVNDGESAFAILLALRNAAM